MTTRDPEQMEEALGEVYGELSFGRVAEELELRQHALVDDLVTWSSAYLGTNVRVGTEGVGGYLVARICAGAYALSSRDGDHPVGLGQSVLLRPDAPLWCRVDHAQIESAELAATEIEDARERFLPYADPVNEGPGAVLVDPQAAAYWWACMSHYLTLMRSPQLYQHDLLRETARENLLAASLVAFGLSEPPADRVAAESIVKRAELYVDDHLAEPLTVPAIAAAVAVSVRSLQQAFRRARESTPNDYLRRARLSAARHDLLTSDPGRVTVAAIARRWGFLNPGRFAARYHDEFDRRPGDDLRHADR